MSHSGGDTLVERAKREAETKGVDIDAVREVDTDSEGVTIRVLGVDAEAETDQVGFDVTRPPGEMGDNLFQRNLSAGLSELKRVLRKREDGDGESDDGESEETVGTGDGEVESDTETEAEPDPDQLTEDPTRGRTARPPEERIEPDVTGTIDVGVSLDEGSLGEIRDELEDLFDDLEEETVSESRVTELENRVDDLDQRLKRLEESLTMLGKLNDPGT